MYMFCQFFKNTWALSVLALKQALSFGYFVANPPPTFEGFHLNSW